jgi:hypothetical protein
MELSLADDVKHEPASMAPSPQIVGLLAPTTLPVNGLADFAAAFTELDNNSNSRNISINAPVNKKNISLQRLGDDVKTYPGFDDVGTLLSPGSIFSTSFLPDTKWTLFESVVFSFWDNILGPKIQHVWTNKKYSYDYISMLSDISNHTLNGEICRDPNDSSIDTKFYHMNERGYIVTAFIFTAIGTTGPSIHSLALVMPQEQLETYLKYHEMCTAFLTRHLAKLRILISGVRKKCVYAMLCPLSRLHPWKIISSLVSSYDYMSSVVRQQHVS